MIDVSMCTGRSTADSRDGEQHLGFTPRDLSGYVWHASGRPVYNELAALGSDVD